MPRWCSLVLISLTIFFATRPAEARRRRRSYPQRHEVRVDFDITIANRANASFFDAQYSFFPVPLQSADEVLPAVRRFVRHPSEIYVRIARDGSTIDTRTSANLGTKLHFLDGVIHFGAQAGFEIDDVNYDPSEGTYTAAPISGEVGARPHPLVSLSAYGKFRPVLDSEPSDLTMFRSTREGSEYEVGGIVAASTPDDSLLVSGSLGWYSADWRFAGIIEGDPTDGPMTIDGLRGTLFASWQSSPRFSLTLRATGSRELWDNDRLNQELLELTPPFEATVYTLAVDLGIAFWYESRLGFRVTLGGGHEGEKPIVNGEARSSVRVGFGVISRF